MRIIKWIKRQFSHYAVDSLFLHYGIYFIILFSIYNILVIMI